MRRRIVAILLLCLPAMLSAQTDSLLLTDYEFAEQQDTWLRSENASGLTRLSAAGTDTMQPRLYHLSEAQLSARRDWGSLADYFEAPKALSFGAHVASYYRLNAKTVLYGSISYDNFSGHDMTGSAFIDPTRQPFDIVEDSLTNPGNKHRDTYHLTGAFGTTVADGFAVGLKLDYLAANYSKYKDLRHKNSLMDLTLTAGLSWSGQTPIGPVQMGADFYYRRNTESLTFATYGKGDKVYKSLVAYATFTGHIETFGENGYTDKSREMPLMSEYTGGGLQLSWDLTPQLQWFNELTLRHRKGYYGKRSPYTISYNEHDSDIYGYHGRLSMRSASALHSIDVMLNAENLEDFANSYREETDNNSATHYEYFTPVKTSNHLWKNGQVAYTAQWAIRHLLPTWSLTLGGQWFSRRQTAYVYPYYRSQDIGNRKLTASLQHSTFLGCTSDGGSTKGGLLSARLSLSHQWGHGEPFHDATFIAPSDKQTPPPIMKAMLYQNYDYVTARQWGVAATVRYAFPWASCKMAPYAELHYAFTKAHPATSDRAATEAGTTENSDGRHPQRQQLSFAIGITF